MSANSFCNTSIILGHSGFYGVLPCTRRDLQESLHLASLLLQVRAVLANGKDLVTASRDKTLILWSEDHTSSGMGAYKQAATLVSVRSALPSQEAAVLSGALPLASRWDTATTSQPSAGCRHRFTLGTLAVPWYQVPLPHSTVTPGSCLSPRRNQLHVGITAPPYLGTHFKTYCYSMSDAGGFALPQAHGTTVWCSGTLSLGPLPRSSRVTTTRCTNKAH